MYKAIGVVSAFACLPALAHAQSDIWQSEDAGFYAGATVGRSKLELTDGLSADERTAGEIGFKALAGFAFNPWFAVEGAYYYPGEATLNDLGLKVDSNVIQGSLLGRFPFSERVTLIARAGLSHWRTKLSSSNGLSSFTARDENNDFTWGLAAEVHAAAQLHVRLEWEQTESNADFGGLPLDLRTRFLQVGAVWRF